MYCSTVPLLLYHTTRPLFHCSTTLTITLIGHCSTVPPYYITPVGHCSTVPPHLVSLRSATVPLFHCSTLLYHTSRPLFHPIIPHQSATVPLFHPIIPHQSATVPLFHPYYITALGHCSTVPPYYITPVGHCSTLLYHTSRPQFHCSTLLYHTSRPLFHCSTPIISQHSAIVPLFHPYYITALGHCSTVPPLLYHTSRPLFHCSTTLTITLLFHCSTVPPHLLSPHSATVPLFYTTRHHKLVIHHSASRIGELKIINELVIPVHQTQATPFTNTAYTNCWCSGFTFNVMTREDFLLVISNRICRSHGVTLHIHYAPLFQDLVQFLITFKQSSGNMLLR